MLNSLPLLLRLQKSHTTWHLDILMDIVKHLQKHRSFQESQSNFQDWILNTEISFLQYGSLHLEQLFSHAVAQKSNSYARMVANFLIGIFFLIVSAMICKWFFGWGGGFSCGHCSRSDRDQDVLDDSSSHASLAPLLIKQSSTQPFFVCIKTVTPVYLTRVGFGLTTVMTKLNVWPHQDP